jgi:hypothetical protein
VGWHDLIAQSLTILSTYGKPIYPYVWAQFHNSIGPIENRGKYLPLDMWAKELTYIRYHSSGAILFGVGTNSGAGKTPDTWASFNPWYQTVLQRIVNAESDTTAPSAPTEFCARIVIPSSADFSRVIVSWQDASDNLGGSGIDGYKIFRDDMLVADTTALLYKDAEVTSGVHIYGIASYDGAGNESARATTTVEVP